MIKLKQFFLLGISSSLLLLSTKISQAFVIPTVDATAIAEGVKSNIELVKQSAVVAEATSITGEINSAIGSAKSTISSLGLEDAQKAAEKIQKEKENLEKAKAEYDKYKAEYDAQKQKLEEGKAAYEKHKAEIEQGISDAQEIKSDISSTINSVQQQAQQATDKVSSSSRQAFGSGNTTTSATTPTVSQTQSVTTPQSTQTSTGNTAAAEALSAAQAEILELRQQLAQAQAQAQTSGQTAPVTTITNDTTPQELEAAKEEIERLKAELAKYEEQSASTPTSAPTEQPSSSGFRKRPNINTNTQYERQSYLDNEEYAVASISRAEELFFAQATVSASDSGDNSLIDLQNVPTGTNAATDEFIVSDDLARYCGFNVNNVDASILKACLEDLIAHRSAANAQTAAEGNTKYTDIMRDSVSSLASEAIVAKNLAANYQDEVLAKLTDDLGSASTVRDDIAALSQTNNQIQVLLNNILKIYASQLYLDSMDKIARYNSRMINPEAETVVKPEDTTE